MQIRKIIYGLALSLCLAGTASYAQSYTPTPVTVSREKVKVNGKIVYSHVVLEKQTLYSISKAYGVSIAEIKAANPSIDEGGLRKNSIILIPATAAAPEVREENTADAVVTKEKENKRETEPGKRTYVVRWFDTLEGIAEKFGVSPESLAKENGISDGKIKARDVLVIPEEVETVDAPAPVVKDKAEESLSPAEETEERFPIMFRKNHLDIALVLPFKAKSASPSTSALDFYSGVLMAVKKLSSEGININLKVFDSSDSVNPLELKKCDFIIGPISPEDISRTCEMAGDVTVISPLDPRAAALTSRYENLIQAPTTHTAQYNDLIQWIIEEHTPGDRIVLVKEKTARKETGTAEMVELLNLRGIEYKTLSYSILEGRDIIEKFRETVCPDREMVVGSDGKKSIVWKPDGRVTRFLIASESEAFVNDVVRNINLLSHENNRLEIYCPSKVRGYDIEASSLHDNNLHVSLAYWIDYDSPQVIDFVKAYRALMNTEPTQFSFQGYDITCWFANHNKEDLLQMSFEFKDGSRNNGGVKRIVYRPGFKIERVK